MKNEILRVKLRYINRLRIFKKITLCDRRQNLILHAITGLTAGKPREDCPPPRHPRPVNATVGDGAGKLEDALWAFAEKRRGMPLSLAKMSGAAN